jgi:hypothetical protein
MMMVVYVFKFGIDNVWGERERAFQRDTPENVCSLIILYSILYLLLFTAAHTGYSFSNQSSRD